MCYNGNIHNTDEIKKYLIYNNVKLKMNNEAYLFFKLIELLSKNINQTNDILLFIEKINNLCKGAYSVIIYLKDIGLIAFKDKYGLKPLLYSDNNCICAIASESIGLEKNNYNNYKDLLNNEFIYVNIFNTFFLQKYKNNLPYTLVC